MVSLLPGHAQPQPQSPGARGAAPGRRAGIPTGETELKKLLVRAAQLVATVLVTWFIASRAGLTLDELRGVDPTGWALRWTSLVASCAGLLAGYALTGWLWGIIVHGLGGPALPAGVSVRLFMIANLGRYVPGKVWQIAGLAALARTRGVAAPTAAGAAILGQGIALAAATLVGLGSVWSLAGNAAWRWSVPAILLGGTAVALVPPVFDALSSLWFRIAGTDRPEGLRSSDAAGWLAVGLASWIVYAGAFWLLVQGLGHDTAPLATASAFAAAYVLGYVAIFAPAGIGVREGFLVALLSPQIGPAAAGAVAVVARLWTTILEVIPAAVFWTRQLATAPGAATKRD